jgi:hypothetical protein
MLTTKHMLNLDVFGGLSTSLAPNDTITQHHRVITICLAREKRERSLPILQVRVFHFALCFVYCRSNEFPSFLRTADNKSCILPT